MLVLNYQRFSAASLLEALGSCEVTTFCAPRRRCGGCSSRRTWGPRSVSALRGCVAAAGEPLNPEVIEQVQQGLGLEHGPGARLGRARDDRAGRRLAGPAGAGRSMGRPLPGYSVVLVDPVTGEPGRDGEICLDLSRLAALH